MREKLIKLWPLALCIAVSLSCSLGSQSGESRDRQSSEAMLSGSELGVEITIRSQGTLSQPGIMVPGDASTIICRGKLRR